MHHRNITRPTRTPQEQPINRTEMAYRLVRRFHDGETLPAHYAQFVPYCLEIVALDERAQRAEKLVAEIMSERILEPSP